MKIPLGIFLLGRSTSAPRLIVCWYPPHVKLTATNPIPNALTYSINVWLCTVTNDTV